MTSETLANRSIGRDLIGAKLRAIRKQQRVTGQELAEQLGCAQSQISRIENGKLKPTLSFIQGFARVLGLSRRERENLEDLVRYFLIEFDRWNFSNTDTLADIQKEVTRLQQRTTFFRSFVWTLLPGFLQTEGYAHYVFYKPEVVSTTPPKKIEKGLKERMKQTALLRNESKRFSFIIAESALRMRVCPKNVMLEQLEHLIEVSGFPNVSLRILPLDIRLKHLPNAFDIYDDRLVVIETETTNINIWHEDDIRTYIRIFNALADCATHSAKEYSHLLGSIVKSLRNSKS